MAKKKSGKKKPAKGNGREPKGQLTREAEDNAKSFDFGGIPDRSLKKNLGC